MTNPVADPSAGNARIRSVYLPPALHKEVEEFARANGMSVSDVLRESMAGFASGAYPPRRRVLKRVTMWIDPKEYAAFTKKARESGVTIRHALELALEKRL